TNFTLIGSPTVTIGQPVALPAIDLTGVSALQNVAAGTTITLRYYASGQTTTGGWGFYSSAAGVNGLAIGGSVAVSSTPNIVASVTSLSAFSSTSGVPSAEQNYTVSGTNLTNDIIVTPPAGFEVSTTSGSGFVTNPSFLTLPQSGGTVNTTTIYVRMNSVTVGANSGNIDNASTGATTKSVALTGSVLASEPTTQSSITFGTITNNSIDVNFSGGNGAKRIVLAKTSTAVNSDPVDGTTYTANAAFGSGTQLGTGNYVVYAGTGNTVTVTGLNGGATYHFAVYEYNDGNTSGAENYFVTTPGTGNATTTASSVTYTWVGGNSSWATPANWSPVRTAGASTDILQFNDGTTVAVTDVPTETIGQLLISAGTQVTLSAAASATLTVGGLAGTDFSVQDGSTLTVSGANALIITLVTGATGSITNSSGITLTGGGHRLIAADAGGVTFGNNAVFTAGTGLSGNPFGGAGTTANSVVFGSGSTFLQIAGSNPFALTQPASVVVFQTGSLYKLQAGLTPSISGRTYANFEFDAAATVSAAASAKFSVDDLRVTNGTLNLGLTGTPGHTIKGNIYVSAGATLNFNPASAGTVNMNGTSTQAITGLGTLTVGVNETFNFDNASGISFTGGNAAFGPLVLTNGKVSLGSSNFSASSITGGSSSNYIITNSTGTVTVNNITTGPAIFPVGPDIFRYNPVTIENGSGHNWSVRVADTITANSGFNTDKAVLLSWIITPSVNPPAAGADVTFQFDEATQVGTSFNAATNVQAWHRVAGAWLRSGIPVAVNTTVPNAATVKVTGLTGFSQYGLSNIDGPLPVVFGTVKATQQSSGGVKVEWSNLTETDVINYAVERSADGRRFTSIGTVNARLNNGGKADYSLVDGSPFSGVNFYRIKSLEIGAKTKYSIIVRVDTRGGATQLVLYPNPVTGGQLSYSAVNLAKGQYALRIFNAAGQLMYNQAINHPGGSVTEAIPMPLVKAGVYTLQLNSADVNLSRTFVVQ
ncbi:MAG: T9SS type A sorting domain-containing protein, partial [Chitinophagaceae bacterium]|nr:T9SS type A sorting domain-containing protein [Chitinophagaceae bacterium]